MFISREKRDNVIISLFSFSFTKMTIINGFRCVFGVEMNNISFLYLLKEVRSTGGVISLISSKDGLQVLSKNSFKFLAKKWQK